MKKLFNDGWYFSKLPPESGVDALDTDRMEPVDLPHDWLIRQPDDLYESADAWYRRILVVEKHADCPVRMLSFDGVYMDCDVLVNRTVVCSHAYGYTAFLADLTDHLVEGENEILVHIRHKSPNTRWYSGSGIFRDVHLLSMKENYVVPDSVYIVSEETENGFNVSFSAEIHGTGTVLLQVRDPDGNTVYEAEKESGRFDFELESVRRWSPDQPALYTFSCGIGEQTEVCRYGFRTTRFDPERGFLINGVRVKLNGVCLHHDLGMLGSAFHEKAARRQLRIMKEMGVNALRTSHNPPARKMLDLCDEMGILVDDEFLDMWERPKTENDYARFFPEHWAEDVALWIRRDRTHPSVILWSLGNEIADMHADARGREVCNMLMKEVWRHDPAHHASVTFGSNYLWWENARKCAEDVGIVGYNYAEKLYQEDHQSHPDWVIYGSETSSVVFSRGIYHFPASEPLLMEEDLQCSSLGNSHNSWASQDIRQCAVYDHELPFSMGQFLWTGMDYIGEPTPYHTRSSYFGMADTCGFPKDFYYFFQSVWTERKMIHIGVTWDWNPGQLVDVNVMSNCAYAELFLNGHSLGKKEIDLKIPERSLPCWQVPYEPGKLEAFGYDDAGNLIAREAIFTPGDTHHFQVEAEDRELIGNRQDMTFITVTAMDENDHPVLNANDRIHVSLKGPGRLWGMDNGDPDDDDPWRTDTKRLFSGKLLIMVGALDSEGTVELEITSRNLPAAKISLPVRRSCPVEGTSCVERIPGVSAKDTVLVRKIEITALGERKLSREHPEEVFEAELLPANADFRDITWKICNAQGIPSGHARIIPEGENRVRVRGLADGHCFLRAACTNGRDHTRVFSQLELDITGMGEPDGMNISR